MQFITVIAAALLATSTMTLFSYLLSENFRKLYKEPVLLQFVMAAFHIELLKHQKIIASWLLHYFIGLLFVILYRLPFWFHFNWYQVTMTSGFVSGCLFGIVGILGWEIMFRSSHARPPVKVSEYYLQLFFAHIIFGVTMAFVFLGFDALFRTI